MRTVKICWTLSDPHTATSTVCTRNSGYFCFVIMSCVSWFASVPRLRNWVCLSVFSELKHSIYHVQIFRQGIHSLNILVHAIVQMTIYVKGHIVPGTKRFINVTIAVKGRRHDSITSRMVNYIRMTLLEVRGQFVYSLGFHGWRPRSHLVKTKY